MKPHSITFSGGLTLLFIYLQLTGQIDWSWWFVLMPWYGGAILGAVAKQLEDKQVSKADTEMTKLCRELGFTEDQIKEIIRRVNKKASGS